MSDIGKHALILGASGISGWALLNQARSYPTPKTFSRITATTNRPLSLKDALISSEEEGRVRLVSGIDFTQDPDDARKKLEDSAQDIKTVTHIFFTAYIAHSDLRTQRDINDNLLSTALSAILPLTPALESFILQTGGKAYGVEYVGKVPYDPPMRETAARIPEPYASNIFYYSQYDILAAAAKGKSWTFNEIRPDVIVGFVPNDNAMDAARGLALYLTLWRKVNGKDAKVPFPATKKAWEASHTDTNQDILARFEIFVALKGAEAGQGEAYNIADAAKPVSWKSKWPGICTYFGLEGAPPEGDGEAAVGYHSFVEKHGNRWGDLVTEHKLKIDASKTYAWSFIQGVSGRDFATEYDLKKAKGLGFTEEIDTVQGYITAFERLKEAGIIPSFE